MLLATQEQLDHALIVVFVAPWGKEGVLFLFTQGKDLVEGCLVQIQTAALHLGGEIQPFGGVALVREPLLAISELSIKSDLSLQTLQKHF